MDVVRAGRRPLGLHYGLIAAMAVALAAAGLRYVPALFHPVANVPGIARETLALDVVRRGTFLRSVRAPGALVPDRLRIVATTADGLVEALPIRAGSQVDAGSIIAILRNADVDAAVVDAHAQLDAARAQLDSVIAEADASRLDRAGTYRSAIAESTRAAEIAHSYGTLHRGGLVGDLQLREAAIKADEDRDLVAIEKRKVVVDAADAAAKVAAARARVQQLSAQFAARSAQAATLSVRAGESGIVQSVAVDRGQRVNSGAELARVAPERDLKAVLQVAESEVRGIVAGLAVTIDTNGAGRLDGRVERIAPAAQNGSIAVDVALAVGHANVRPAQNVDGTIELSRVPNAVSMLRPPNATDGSSIYVYRLSADRSRALRTVVRLGAGSLERVQITAGLSPGDTIIVSDTSSFADAPELRLQ